MRLRRIKWHRLEDKPIHLTVQHRVWAANSPSIRLDFLRWNAVVLNALTNTCGFAAGYLRLRRTKWHRPAAAGRFTFAPVGSDSGNVRGRNHNPAHFAKANAVTISLTPAGDR